MHIRCLMQSTWKIRNGEAQSAGETTPCCPPPIHSRVSEQSKLLGWQRASRPFVEQLTIFCTSGLILASSSIFRVLNLHRAMASWVARAKSMHKPVYFIRKPVTGRHTYSAPKQESKTFNFGNFWLYWLTHTSNVLTKELVNTCDA